MVFLVFILYAAFGFTFTLGKIVLNYATPFFVVATRMLIGGAALFVYTRFISRTYCAPSRQDLRLYTEFTFFNIFFFYSTRAWALQYLSTVKASLLFNLLPFFTAFFAYIFLRERLTLRKSTGLLLGCAGMLPILLAKAPDSELAAGHFFAFSYPEIIFIIAVASLSYSMIVMRKLVKHRACNPIVVNALCMLAGGMLCLITSVGLQEKMVFGDPVMFGVVIGLLIIVSNLICSNLQAYLLKHYSPTFMALASIIMPLCAAGYGWLLLGETITWHFFLSFSIVALGLVVYYFDELRTESLVRYES